MTLRARLITSFAVLMLVVIALVGAVAIRSTRRVLIDQIEDRIRTASAADMLPNLGRDQPPVGRTLAIVILDRSGGMVRSLPSGLPGRFDPLPDTSLMDDLPVQPGAMFTLPAVSGSNAYRAMSVPARDGRTYVIAHTLRDLAQAEAALARRLLTGGGLVLLAGIGGVWLTVRRGLRPVDDMIDTAAAIAAGDLSQRVPAADPESELGRLGTSLNHMLTNIEDAFAAEGRANWRLKQFVADASHELRTPLAAISGYTELVGKGAFEDAQERQGALHRIEAETKRMGRLVDDLMLLARLDLAETGASAPLEIRKVDLAAVVRDAMTDHNAIDGSRPVTADDGTPQFMSGDSERLTQVVANLLANLRAHTPEGTVAHLAVYREGDRIRLDYRDHGPGLAPESVDRIFDRFYRADPSRIRKSGGAGLGLAIVAAIVEAHGGSVSAHNHSEGGTLICLTFPVPDLDSRQPLSQPSDPSQVDVAI